MDKVDFEYYGLFLTDESKNKLKSWLTKNDSLLPSDFDSPENKVYLDHCTLLHKTQLQVDKRKALYLKKVLDLGMVLFGKDKEVSFEITAIGYNDSCAAFKCDVADLSLNENPHITIYTTNDGKPKDCNAITNWIPIEKIEVIGVIDVK